MTENDLFNRDTMYWRDINYAAPTAFAEVELVEPLFIGGNEMSVLNGPLLNFESGVVEYEMENGGAFTKNEVLAWPFILDEDLAYYLDESNSLEERNSRVYKIDHNAIQGITLKDKSNTVIAQKAKI